MWARCDGGRNEHGDRARPWRRFGEAMFDNAAIGIGIGIALGAAYSLIFNGKS